MRKILTVCAMLLFVTSPLAMAKDEAAPSVRIIPRTVAAFKNGLAFVFGTAKADLVDGCAIIDRLPQATLGGLWIGTTNRSAKVEEVTSITETVEKQRPASGLADLLAGNVGKSVTVFCRFGDSKEPTRIDGVVMETPNDDTSTLAPNPNASSRYGYSNNQSTPVVGQFVALKTLDGRIVAISKPDILSVSIPGDSTMMTVSGEIVNRAKVRVSWDAADHQAPNVELAMSYIEKGITWSPSYLVDLTDESKAEITLEAVLANDVEDLQDADVSFVVGYPNFLYSDILTPLSSRQSVASFIERLSQGPLSNTRSGGYGAVMSQSGMYNAPTDYQPGAADVSYATPRNMPGETNEDLYFYRQPHVTMKKGTRERFTVFTSKVPYEHIYLWDVPDSMNVNDTGRPQSSDNRTVDPTLFVWHALRLRNETELPWTTAPALVINHGLPVAQDILNYTPHGGSNTLKLTVATDVRAEQEQTELSRSQVTIVQSVFDDISVKGTLTLTNSKDKAIRVKVTKSLMGEVLEASDEGKTRVVAKRLIAVNPQSEIGWEFSLPAGAKKQLTYTYKLLIYR